METTTQNPSPAGQIPGVGSDGSGSPSEKIVGTGFEISVPIFVENGDKVEIDTRTHEYRKRV